MLDTHPSLDLPTIGPFNAVYRAQLITDGAALPASSQRGCTTSGRSNTTPLELAALKTIIETVDQGVLIVDQRNQLIMCNQLFLRMWKIPDRLASDYQSMMNYIQHQLVHPDLFVATMVSINGQPGAEIVDDVLLKDGRTIERHSRPVRIEDLMWRVWYFRDITTLKAIKGQEQQQDRLTALGQLVASVAHELNNPLAAVLGLAQLMLRQDLPDQLRDDLHGVEMSAQRAKHLVTQMLTSARSHQGVQHPVDVGSVIERVVANLRRHSHIDDIQVDVHIQGTPTIFGHAYQIEQVLDNLLHNAIHALRACPQEQRRITVEASVTGTQVLVKMTDTGPGIPSHILTHIFDPFFTTKEAGHGTGLGLSFVHNVITQHGGAIRVESVVGQGTSFSIELPASMQADHHLPSRVDRPSVSLPQSILVIEDELFVRLVIERELKERGCRVDTAANGRDGLQKILTGQYDLVISDLRMPDMNGNDLFAHVHASNPSLSWVFVTGDTMNDGSEAFLRESGMPVLAKPFTLDELWDTIEH